MPISCRAVKRWTRACRSPDPDPAEWSCVGLSPRAIPQNDDGPRAAQRESRPDVQIARPAEDSTSIRRGAAVRRAAGR
jgi:hypothetical protein